MKMNLKSANYLLLLFFQLLFIFSTKCFAFSLDKNEEPSSEIEEQVNVFIGKVIRPVTYAGSGWLSGAFSNEQPGDKLLLPLKTQRVRGREDYICSVYDKCKKLGISMELVTNKKDDWKALALDGDCHINTLQGMLNKTNREPRSLWWMYKSYGDLTGQIVEVASGNTTDAVVAIDARFNSADVVEERIENSEDLPLKNPEKTFKQSLKFRNGQMEVILDDLRSFDAYTLTISLSEKKL